MVDVIDDKATAISKLAIHLPSYKKTFIYLFALSFFAGFLLRLGMLPEARDVTRLSESLLYGGAEGLLLLGVPALFSSVLAASLSRKEDFAHRLKHFSFISLAATAISVLFYLGGVLLSPRFTDLSAIVLLSNSVVFLAWFAALFVMLNYGPKSFVLAFFHPVFNLSFLVIWSSLLLAPADPAVLLFKFAVSSLVLLLAFASIFYILNAPAKRNFGISTLQTATLFFAQLVYGKKDIEDVLAGMGEDAETFLSTVAFRRRNGKLKAVFLVPHLHYGPFGNVGGSEFPYLISKQVQDSLHCPALVFHGTANHDLNPVYSFSSSRLAAEFTQTVQNFSKPDYSGKASFLYATHKSAKVAGLSFQRGRSFFALTRAPDTTDDISLPLGISLAEKLRGRGFEEPILVDMHNSKGDDPKMAGGSPDYFEFYDLFSTLKDPRKKRPFQLGVAEDALSDFTPTEGVGKAGLKVAVFQVGTQRAGFILLDANNVFPPFRRQLLLHLLSAFHFAFCDVLTTDTHSVNSFSSVHNPLGSRVDWDKLSQRIVRSVKKAVRDLEFCEAAVSNKRTTIEVLGAGRTSELLSTVSAIVSIAKIFAPVIFVLSILLALMLLQL